jgi:NADH dehydrogenase
MQLRKAQARLVISTNRRRSTTSRGRAWFEAIKHGDGREAMAIKGRTRIVILGGGFGGLYAALRLEKTLARDPEVEILLVNRENFFLFTPMLHEVAASDLDLTHIVNPVRKLLRRVQFFDGDVDDIDLPGRKVAVSHGAEHHSHELTYDHLVIALGSITNFFNLPGLAERALTMKSLGDAIFCAIS